MKGGKIKTSVLLKIHCKSNNDKKKIIQKIYTITFVVVVEYSSRAEKRKYEKKLFRTKAVAPNIGGGAFPNIRHHFRLGAGLPIGLPICEAAPPFMRPAKKKNE